MDLLEVGIQGKSEPNLPGSHISHLALDIGGYFLQLPLFFFVLCIFFGVSVFLLIPMDSLFFRVIVFVVEEF